MKKDGFKIGLTILALLALISGDTILPASANYAFNDPAFSHQWNRLDEPVQDSQMPSRGYTWGPPVVAIGQASSEIYDGKPRSVQYFEKARMEINPQISDPTNPWHVTTGLLVKEMVTGQRQEGDNTFATVSPNTEAVAGDPSNPLSPTYSSFNDLVVAMRDRTSQAVDRQVYRDGRVSLFQPPETRTLSGYDPVTGHNIADVFEAYTRQTGPVYNGSYIYDEEPLFSPNSLYVLGHPITEPYWTKAIVGGTEKVVMVQLFERRALTYTPSNTANNKVEMANVGLHYFNWRYQPPTAQACRQGMPDPQTPKSPAKSPQDFSQPAVAYLSSGPIPEGGPGRVFAYTTGLRNLYGTPAISQDGTLAVILAGQQGLIGLRLSDNPAQTCEAWRYNPPGGNSYGDPLLYNGLAIVSDTDGTLHAVRLSDGSPVWTSKQPRQVYAVGTPITDGTNLYFAGVTNEIVSPMYGPVSGHLYALRLSDGGLVWQSPNINGAGGKTIFGFDGNIIFGGWDKAIYSYTRDGQPVPGWPSKGVGIIASGPTGLDSFSFVNDRLYVSNGGLYALDRNGQIVDSYFPINSQVVTLPTVVGDTVYVGLQVYTDDKTPEGVPIFHQVLEVRGLNATNFKEVKFRFHTDFSPGSNLTVVDGYIYFGASERFFQVRADGSGFNRQMFLAGDSIGGIPVVRNGRVYVTSVDGNFYIVT